MTSSAVLFDIEYSGAGTDARIEIIPYEHMTFWSDKTAGTIDTSIAPTSSNPGILDLSRQDTGTYGDLETVVDASADWAITLTASGTDPLVLPRVRVESTTAAAVDDVGGVDILTPVAGRLYVIDGSEDWRGTGANISSFQPENIVTSPSGYDSSTAHTDTANFSEVPDGSDSYALFRIRWNSSVRPEPGSFVDLAFTVAAGTIPEDAQRIITSQKVGAFIEHPRQTPRFTQFNPMKLALVFSDQADYDLSGGSEIVFPIGGPGQAETQTNPDRAALTGSWLEYSQSTRVGHSSGDTSDLTGGFTFASIGLRWYLDEGDSIPAVGLFPSYTEALPGTTAIPGGAADTWIRFFLDGANFDVNVSGTGVPVADADNPPRRMRFNFAWIDPSALQESAPSPDSAIIEVEGTQTLQLDLSGFKKGMPTGVDNAVPESRVTQAAIYMHVEDWGTDVNNFPLFHLIKEVTIADEKLLRTELLIEDDMSFVQVNRSPFYEHGVPPATQLCVSDRERLIYAGMPDYSVGRLLIDTKSSFFARGDAELVEMYFAYTNNSGDAEYFLSAEITWATGLPTAGADPPYTADPSITPNWGPFVEGRTITFEGSDVEGLIRKAIFESASGAYTKLWVSRTPDAGTELKYVIRGIPNRIWWSLVNPEGAIATQEFVSPAFGFKDLEMPGDAIQALAHVGDYLIVVGRRFTTYLLQNTIALDGVQGTGQVFPRPRSTLGGCVSGRTVAELPNRQAVWLSPEGKLMIATTNGLSVHPASEQYKGWLTSQLRVDQNQLRHSHGYYHDELNAYLLFLPESATTGDLVGGFATWPNSRPVDPHVDWMDQT